MAVFPLETSSEETDDFCKKCQREDCEGCDYQSPIDEFLGIFPFHDNPLETEFHQTDLTPQQAVPTSSAGPVQLGPKPNRLDFSVQNSAPAKRPRGRPRKKQEDDSSFAPGIAKRRPGRLDDFSIAPGVAKRRPGRLDDSSIAPGVAKRRPGRLDDSIIAPGEAKRRPGGQPGNLNALKHGLYVQGSGIYNTNPVERAMLFDFNTALIHLKDFFDYTFENGFKKTSMSEINETLRTLSIASLAMVRIADFHDHHIYSGLPNNLSEAKKSSMTRLIDHFDRKVSSFMDYVEINIKKEDQEEQL
jgi:hypothetical protein